MSTYISSLITPADSTACGLYAPKSAGPGMPAPVPMFYGNVVLKTGIVFPDGTIQTSAAKSTGSSIDVGTF